MSDTIYLYLKTHNDTGLKYLGKTVQDPYKYKGSGTRWLNHIKKHGRNITTEILFETTDKEEFSDAAKVYSTVLDIVNSSLFANIMEETGAGGKTSGSFKKGHIPANKGLTGLVYTEQRRKNMSISRKGKKGNHCKKVITPLGIFDTVKDAAIAHNYSGSPAFIKNKLKNDRYPEYRYLVH